MTAEDCRAQILAAEEKAQSSIERELRDLRGVHGDVIAYVEGRWLRWLDATVARIERTFDEANPV